MQVVYVAGPYKASNAWKREQNVRLSEEVSLKLWEEGYAVICMNVASRFYEGTLDEEIFLRGDFEILSRCNFLVVLDGWNSSSGTKAEIAEALKLGIPCYRAWIGSKGQLEMSNETKVFKAMISYGRA